MLRQQDELHPGVQRFFRHHLQKSTRTSIRGDTRLAPAAARAQCIAGNLVSGGPLLGRCVCVCGGVCQQNPHNNVTTRVSACFRIQGEACFSHCIPTRTDPIYRNATRDVTHWAIQCTRVSTRPSVIRPDVTQLRKPEMLNRKWTTGNAPHSPPARYAAPTAPISWPLVSRLQG